MRRSEERPGGRKPSYWLQPTRLTESIATAPLGKRKPVVLAKISGPLKLTPSIRPHSKLSLAGVSLRPLQNKELDKNKRHANSDGRTRHNLDRCKERPTDTRPKGGSGARKAFVPWCSRRS